jgi:hypothetical protein
MVSQLLGVVGGFIASKVVDAGVNAGVSLAADAFKNAVGQNASPAQTGSAKTVALKLADGPKPSIEKFADGAASDGSVDKK